MRRTITLKGHCVSGNKLAVDSHPNWLFTFSKRTKFQALDRDGESVRFSQ